QGVGSGGEETVDLLLREPGVLQARIADNAENSNYKHRSARFYDFAVGFKAEGSEFEPNDTPEQAKRLSLGAPVTENLFPAGDEDWFKLAVEHEGALDVVADQVPSNIAPMIEVYRLAEGGKVTRALRLACRKTAPDLAPRLWGCAVDWTRVNATDAAAAGIMDKLAEFDVVLLDGLFDARLFGMDQPATWKKIEKFAEGGGRFILAGPFGYSFSLVNAQRGGRLREFSSQWDGGHWNARHVCDGMWGARNPGTGWCAGSQVKPPHWFVFDFGGQTRKLDRVVVYNTSQSNEARSKEIEILTSGADGEFKSAGKFTLAQNDERQEFKFGPVEARRVKFVILSNYGHGSETQLGEIEFYGPGDVEGLFGLRHWMQGLDGPRVEALAPKHWIVSGQSTGRADSWPGWESGGWFMNAKEAGFEVVYALAGKPEGRAVTLCKAIGKGFLVVDAQDVAQPGRDDQTNWKLGNLLGVKPALLGRFADMQRQGRGGESRFRLSVAPGVYLLRMLDTEPWRWAMAKLRLAATLTPADRPFEPNDTPECAGLLPAGVTLASQLFPADDVDWFRLFAVDKTTLKFEMTDVPDGIEPVIEVFAAGSLEKPLGRFTRTTGGGPGWPQAFSIALPAKGEYLAKVTSPGWASLKRFHVRATYDAAPVETGPRVMSVSPPDGFSDASARPRLVVNFDRPMNAATVNEKTLSLSGAMSGAIPVKVAYDAEACQAVVEPLRDLAPGESATLVLGGGIADAQGKKLGTDAKSLFAVAAPEGRAAFVRVAMDPPPPLRAGTVKVSLLSTTALRDVKLAWRAGGGAARPVEDLRQEAPGRWSGVMRVAADTPNGAAAFEFSARDAKGGEAPDISEGKTFEIDTAPPPALAALSAAAAPAGKARVSWSRPEGVADVAGYRLYRAERETPRREDMTLVKELAGAEAVTWEDATPKDGGYCYYVAAVDRAGNEGPLSPAARVETDRVAPVTPVTGAEAVVTEKPRIDLKWRPVQEPGVAGYAVFRFKKGEAIPLLDSVKPLTETNLERVSIQDFPGHGEYVYAVAARDKAGNYGPPATASVVLDLHPPEARITLSAKPPFTPGDYTATVKLNEPLKEPLRMSARLADGTARPLEVAAKDETTYEAKMTFGPKDPEGQVTLLPDGEDRYGNKGIRVVDGGAFHLDTEPPKAWVYTQPEGRLKAGKVGVIVDVNEDLKDAPKLIWTVGGKRSELTLKKEHNRRFRGEFEITADTPNGPGQFDVEATDLYAHTGGAVVRGKDFVVDTQAPEPPPAVTVKPGPEKKLWAQWMAPVKEPVAFYRVYGAPTPDVKPSKETLLADNVRELRALHTPKAEQPMWLAVTAVDYAGNESEPSRPVKAEPDMTPPPAPEKVETMLLADGRVKVSWPASKTDENVRYRLFRSTAEVKDAAGLKPLAETAETFAVDAPKDAAVYHYAVAAVDEAGNVSPLAAAKPLDYDTGPPTARVDVSPTDGQKDYSDRPYEWRKIGVLSAGEKTVTLTPSEKLGRPPRLRYRTRSMDTPREIALTEDKGAWKGRLTIPEKTDDGLLTFSFEGE
ncbi:MAG TPA: discoidin domain-containing protein, partial [Candidatus Brocadiia bacterium]|nr:discoidin domain-containing protein [Candidatus Brocadiia bacterium]